MINFSVIIPTCNRNDLLSECLVRLAPETQVSGNFTYEVIVTDDGKVASAKELIQNKFNWAKWVEGPSKGPATNRNNGAKNAKCDWLVFLDDDCVPDLDLLSSYADMITADGSIEVIEGLIYSDEKMEPFYFAPVNVTGGYLWSCNFAIKVDAFNKVEGFDQNFKYPHMEDMDLNKRLKATGYLVIFNNKAKVYHAPRLVTDTKKLALYHESWIYFNAKDGVKISLISLLLDICNVRLRYLFKSTRSLTFVKGLSLLVQELYYTVKFSKNWNSR